MPAGRPKIEIDWEEFDKLCEMQATLIEISGWFGCSEDTIERRVQEVKGENFAEYYKKQQGKGKASLRRDQWKSSHGGNVTMQIWLGKQVLGQKDKQTQVHEIDEDTLTVMRAISGSTKGKLPNEDPEDSSQTS